MILPAVLKHLSGMEGLYKQAPHQLNGYKYWIQKDVKHAIWFSRDSKCWMIGEYELRGRKDAKIRSKSNVQYSRPYGGDEYQWQYHNSGRLMGFWDSAGWFDAPDIQVVEGKNSAFVIKNMIFQRVKSSKAHTLKMSIHRKVWRVHFLKIPTIYQ